MGEAMKKSISPRLSGTPLTGARCARSSARACRGLIAALALTSAASVGRAQSTVTLDETYTLIELNESVTTLDSSQPAQVTYKPELRLRFYGDVHSGDAVRVVLKQGNTELGAIRCPLTYRRADADDGVAQSVDIEISDGCWHRNSPDLSVHGPVDIELHYLDDQRETSTLLRTLHVEIARTWRVDRVIGGAPIHSPRFFVLGDDLLGLAWVWLRTPPSTQNYGMPSFYFWAHTDRSDYPEASFRCYRDGERVPELDLSGRNIHESVADWTEQDDATRGGTRASTHYRYRLMRVMTNWRWGTNRAGAAQDGDSRPSLTATPGSYVCKFRSEGVTVREFHFTVANNTITPHPAQTAAGGLTLRPGAVFVETRLGDATPYDIAVVPDAIRRGTAFGHAWADPASVRDMLGALPAARGVSVPPLPDGVAAPRPTGRGRGRRR
jgi:hypothetical protein